jgi:hypothetical protein
MRIVNVAVATVAVLAGFAGSMSAAQAMTSADPILGLDLPLPILTFPGPVAAEPTTDLVVTFKAGEESKPQVLHLQCDPAGGDHPRADEACDVLADAQAEGTDPFAAPPKNQMCTFIYGGPQTAVVKGTWNGKAVDRGFSRTNGCEMSRWDAIEPVLSPTAPPAED